MENGGDFVYKAFFAVWYGVALYISSNSIQRLLFALCIGSNDQVVGGKWLLRVACRTGKQVKYIEQVKKCNKLTDNEKRYLTALAWRNLGLYNKAWGELRDIKDKNAEIDNLKCNTLYNSRNVKELLALNEEVSVASALNEKQKDYIIRYTFKNHGANTARDLCDIFQDDSFTVNVLFDNYKELEKCSQTWKAFLKTNNHRGFNLKDENEIEKCLVWLNSLPIDQGKWGLDLLLNKVVHKSVAFSTVTNKIRKLEEKRALNPNLIGNNIKYILTAEENLRKNNLDQTLKILIKAYEEGDRSQSLYIHLFRALEQGGLPKKYYHELSKIVDEGFIDLASKDALYLLVNCTGFHEMYNGVHLKGNKEALNDLILHGGNLPERLYKEFLKQIIDPFIDSSEPLPFNETSFDILSSNLTGMHKWDCLQVRWYVQNKVEVKIDDYLNQFTREKQQKILLYVAKYCHEKKINQLALKFGKKAYKISPNNVVVLRRLIASHHLLGNINQRLEFIKKLRKKAPERLFNLEYEMALDEYLLKKNEWNWSRKRKVVERGNAIVHVLNKSLPEVNGYTIRSIEIVEHQKNSNLHPVVVTKLGYPVPEEAKERVVKENHNGVDHYRLYGDKKGVILNKVPQGDYFRVYADEFARVIREIQPRVIHAASNFQSALPALKVAQKYNIPSVYEVRGLWHDTQCTKVAGFENSERYLLHQEYELICCRTADRVVAISKSLKEHLIALGIPDEKIYFVPNGVDVKKFSPQNPDSELQRKYNLEGKMVIGFIGSVTHYEGLDYLLKALVELKKLNLEFRFLLVGDGKALPDLKKLAKELDVEDVVIFVGRVPHDEVKDYYSVVDVFPFPRTSSKVCQLVTPLKPYEAMAMGKLVLVSDIPALREMVIEGETGLVFKSEDVDSLVKCLLKVEDNKRLARQGRNWVVKNRAWDQLAEKYIEIYEI